MPDHRRSLVDFQRRFPGEAACSTCLATLHRREGFRVPSLAFMTGAGPLRTKPWTYECRQD